MIQRISMFIAALVSAHGTLPMIRTIFIASKFGFPDMGAISSPALGWWDSRNGCILCVYLD